MMPGFTVAICVFIAVVGGKRNCSHGRIFDF